MLRFIYILSVLGKYAVIFLLMKLNLYRKPKEKLFKQFFEEAGGSFIKFGQLLSLRVDILPKEYSHEMLDLLDNVRSFPYSDVMEIFLQELGAAPEKIFYDFQKEPFASGSFGQVHAAKIDKDTIVAVKIMRPGIEEQVQADFLVVDTLAFFADIFFHFEGLSWREFASEFKRWTLQELDYHKEAENAERMEQNLTKEDLIVVPHIYSRFSTRQILVQEYIEGVHLSRVLRGLKDGRLNADSLLEMGIDIKKAASTLTQELMKQYFLHGFFHADLHPGNIILLQHDKIALIDFGIMGETLTPSQSSFLNFMKNLGENKFKESTFYFANVVGGDLRQMIQSAFPASIDQKSIDDFMHIITDRFSEEVEKISTENKAAIKNKKTDYSVVLMKIMAAAQNYKIHVPKEFAIFIKSLSTLGLLAKEMDYDYQLQREIKKFFTTYPVDSFKVSDNNPFRRTSRERALEQLNNWLAYLLERDPEIYNLVRSYITQYNKVDQ